MRLLENKFVLSLNEIIIHNFNTEHILAKTSTKQRKTGFKALGGELIAPRYLFLDTTAGMAPPPPSPSPLKNPEKAQYITTTHDELCLLSPYLFI